MARPIKTFTDDETRDLIRYLVKRAKLGGWEFSRNLKSHCACDDATEALDALTKASSPGALRYWIDKWLSPEGWTRIQAAMRQSAVKERSETKDYGKRDQLTKITRDASMNFDDLAKSARITRKDYLVFLGRWLTKTNAGQKAAKEFSIYAGNEKLIKAGNAFIE